MIIHVVGLELNNAKWRVLWDNLSAAEEAGISYKIFDWLKGKDETIEECDAFIYIDMEHAFGESKPFVNMWVADTEDEVLQKIQLIAGYLMGDIVWDHEPECKMELLPLPEEETVPWVEEPGVVDPFEEFVTFIYDETVKLELPPVPVVTDLAATMSKIKHFCVDIEGNKVNLEPADMIILVQMRKLMEEFGYKIEKVVV